jgi:hypothetical protein
LTNLLIKKSGTVNKQDLLSLTKCKNKIIVLFKEYRKYKVCTNKYLIHSIILAVKIQRIIQDLFLEDRFIAVRQKDQLDRILEEEH